MPMCCYSCHFIDEIVVNKMVLQIYYLRMAKQQKLKTRCVAFNSRNSEKLEFKLLSKTFVSYILIK